MKTKQTESTEPAQQKELDLTHVALGVFKDFSNNTYYVAEVKYNPVTGEAKLINRVSAGPGRDYGAEQFRLKAVEHELV